MDSWQRANMKLRVSHWAVLLLVVTPWVVWQGWAAPVAAIKIGEGGVGPPATYYGPVLAGSGFTPAAGMSVTAYIGSMLCGQTQTMLDAGQVVYSIQVEADDPLMTGCGAAGRVITFWVETQVMTPTALWDNSHPHYLPLGSLEATPTPTATATETFTPTSTDTPTPTPTRTGTHTETPTPTPTATEATATTLTPTPTPTPTPGGPTIYIAFLPIIRR